MYTLFFHVHACSHYPLPTFQLPPLHSFPLIIADSLSLNLTQQLGQRRRSALYDYNFYFMLSLYHAIYSTTQVLTIINQLPL